MISYTKGDILQSPAQVITNTVNCVGVMGKGLAAQFKTKYPAMFQDYAKRCASGDVKPGQPYLFENDEVQVLNFPTKRDWRNPSLLQDIDGGLKYLAEHYRDMGIYTLALPPLGCGLGGLNWSDVKSLIEKHLSDLPDLEVFVYVPDTAEYKTLSSDTSNASTPKTSDALAAQEI